MDYLHYFKAARSAARSLAILSEEHTAAILTDLADAVDKQTAYILEENRKDLDRMNPADPKFDRLQLSAVRLADIANDIRNVARLRSPLGTVISSHTRPNGLQISKIRVPLGVIGIIYEARPNVTLDVFSLCFKTGNVCLLKGGSDAKDSNTALAVLIHQVLHQHNLPEEIVSLLPVEREASDALLNAVGYVDVLIPRGSQSLIDHVRRNSRVPVIETGAGIVHTYFDEWGDLSKGRAIIENAKTRRVSVCNALDCLLVDRNRLTDLAELVRPLAQKDVELFADEDAYATLQSTYPPSLLNKAEEEHFGTEFLSLKMAIKTVNGINEALDHIAEYGSKHSEAIITEKEANERLFLQRVDAAAVYSNASTSFTDGAQFGLGAEIGISTQKLHARGPMGLEELTSYKWVIKGDGQIRG